MRFSFRNPEGRVGAVSDSDTLIYRGLNTGYFSKWAGLWVPPYKYMDFHAYRVNGTWLAPGTISGAEYGDAFVHHFDLDSLQVEERLEPAEEFAGAVSKLKVTNNSGDPKAIRTGLEIGVDIREKSCDIGPEEYNVDRGDQVTVSTGDRSFTVGADESFEKSGEPHIREHEPGGERQKCLVPGEMGFRWELQPGEEKVLEIYFRTDRQKSEIEPGVPEQTYEGKFSRSFTDAARSMENLSYGRSGGGILAGHPWFQSYWARDTFWTLLGMIDAGAFNFSRKVLENYAERGLPGKISLATSEEPHARSDTYPLFVIAADKLKRHHSTSKTIEESVEKAMKQLEIEDGVVKHPPEGTWMDTLERGPAVDLQSLWLRACRITGDSRAKELEKGMERFVTDDFMKDFLGENSPRAVNVAVPLMFGQLEHEDAAKVLQRLNGEFSSRYGARTRSVADPGYQSYGYHTGSAWGLTTGWAAAANFRYGKLGQGQNFLERLSRTGDMKQPGGFPEVLDAENGNILGCTEQAWSAGLLVHAIDSYMLGIHAESPDKLEVDPSGNVNGRREKLVGDESVELVFEDGEVTVESGEVEVECL